MLWRKWNGHLRERLGITSLTKWEFNDKKWRHYKWMIHWVQRPWVRNNLAYLRKRKKSMCLELTQKVVWDVIGEMGRSNSIFPLESSTKSLEGFKHRNNVFRHPAYCVVIDCSGSKNRSGILVSDFSHSGKRWQQLGLGWWPWVWRKVEGLRYILEVETGYLEYI